MSRRGVVVVVLVGVLAALVCGCGGTKKASAPSPTALARQEQNTVAETQARLIAAQPAPVITHSQEREQVSRRAERFEASEKLGFVYLISYGRVMAMYPVKGKVSSLNSYLIAQETVYHNYGSSWGLTVSAPDIDGTYGENVEGIFFFTPEDVYVEWNGDYMYCDAPLKMSTQPDIVYIAPLK